MAEKSHIERYLDEQIERANELVKQHDQLNKLGTSLAWQLLILVLLSAGMLIATWLIGPDNVGLSIICLVAVGLTALWSSRIGRTAIALDATLIEAKAIAKQLEMLSALSTAVEVERAPGPGTRPDTSK